MNKFGLCVKNITVLFFGLMLSMESYSNSLINKEKETNNIQNKQHNFYVTKKVNRFRSPKVKILSTLGLLLSVPSQADHLANKLGSMRKHRNIQSLETSSVIGTNTEYDSLQVAVDRFFLKPDSSPVFIEKIKDAVITGDGEEYLLTEILTPITGIFSKKYYELNEDGTEVRDTRNDEIYKILVFKGTYDNGAQVLVVKNNEGDITYVELHRFDKPITYYIHESTLNGIVSFDDLAIDQDKLTSLGLGDAVPPYASRHRNLLNKKRRVEKNVKESSTCQEYKALDASIVYDGEFCEMYGSTENAQGVIQAIVARASHFYEKDVCLKLQITNIDSPDKCSSVFSVFDKLSREDPCTFLNEFAKYMDENHDEIDKGASSVVHHFSGYPNSGVIGCAWIGSACDSHFNKGVNLFRSVAGNIHLQSVLFAHELGHNLAAAHSDGENLYVMHPYLTAATGFSSESVNSINHYLEQTSNECDYVLNETEITDGFLDPSINGNSSSFTPTSSLTFEPTVNQSNRTYRPTISNPDSNVPTIEETLEPTRSEIDESYSPTSLVSMEPTYIPTSDNQPTVNPTLDDTTMVPTTSPSWISTQQPSLKRMTKSGKSKSGKHHKLGS